MGNIPLTKLLLLCSIHLILYFAGRPEFATQLQQENVCVRQKKGCSDRIATGCIILPCHPVYLVPFDAIQFNSIHRLTSSSNKLK